MPARGGPSPRYGATGRRSDAGRFLGGSQSKPVESKAVGVALAAQRPPPSSGATEGALQRRGERQLGGVRDR